jgi:hypothetical protein
MGLPSMNPDGADRKRDAFKVLVLALTFHNPHLSEPAFFAETSLIVISDMVGSTMQAF